MDLVATGYAIIGQVIQLPLPVIGAILVGVVIIGFKVFQYIFRLFIIGGVFAILPVGLVMLGFNLPLNASTILTSALLGIGVYFAYSSANFGYRVLSRALSPFSNQFPTKKEKAHKKEIQVIKIVEEKKKKN